MVDSKGSAGCTGTRWKMVTNQLGIWHLKGFLLRKKRRNKSLQQERRCHVFFFSYLKGLQFDKLLKGLIGHWLFLGGFQYISMVGRLT